MSYCRWSSDNFHCDLYCYADANGGWTTHVAYQRAIGEVPPLPSWDKLDTMEDAKKFSDAVNAQISFMETAKMQMIGGPCDGATFNDPTLAEFKIRLLDLRRKGYIFPDCVLDQVEKELNDE